jgi:hypothetical protein
MNHRHHEQSADFFQLLIFFVIAAVGIIIFRALN